MLCLVYTGVVARDRQRYQGLDITCLHEQPNILAMSFPATGLARTQLTATVDFVQSVFAACKQTYTMRQACSATQQLKY